MNSVNVVYKLEDSSIVNEAEGLLADYQLVEWIPSLCKIIPTNVAVQRIGYLKNWFFHLPGLLFKRGKLYSVYALVNSGEVLCQCIVTPASIRYKFIKPHDLQFGLVYTLPNSRNKRLAHSMVNAIIKKLSEPGRTFWWITEVDNIPSRRLCERIGFTFVGKATRKSLMGFSYYSLINGNESIRKSGPDSV